jgi:transposase
MEKKYVVELTAEERVQLEGMVKKGKALARKIQHAQILLKADQGVLGPGWPDAQIAQAYGVAVRTVEHIRERLVEHGLDEALTARRQREQAPRRKLDGAAEAKLVAIACTPAPEGRVRWTIRLLADKMVELRIVDSLGRETVRQTLKKTKLNLG